MWQSPTFCQDFQPVSISPLRSLMFFYDFLLTFHSNYIFIEVTLDYKSEFICFGGLFSHLLPTCQCPSLAADWTLPALSAHPLETSILWSQCRGLFSLHTVYSFTLFLYMSHVSETTWYFSLSLCLVSLSRNPKFHPHCSNGSRFNSFLQLSRIPLGI